MKKTISFWLVISVLSTFFTACTTTPPANKIADLHSTGNYQLGFVTEPQKKIPVVYDVDVVVAGGGVSGVFAALAAAREGASVVLIDRFGSVGGSDGLRTNGTGGLWPSRTLVAVNA